MKDWRGVEIVVGSTIVYPGRHSSSMWMCEATVLNITERKGWHGTVPVIVAQPVRGKARKVVLTCIDRVTVVHEAR